MRVLSLCACVTGVCLCISGCVCDSELVYLCLCLSLCLWIRVFEWGAGVNSGLAVAKRSCVHSYVYVRIHRPHAYLGAFVQEDYFPCFP